MNDERKKSVSTHVIYCNHFTIWLVTFTLQHLPVSLRAVSSFTFQRCPYQSRAAPATTESNCFFHLSLSHTHTTRRERKFLTPHRINTLSLITPTSILTWNVKKVRKSQNVEGDAFRCIIAIAVVLDGDTGSVYGS